MLFFERGPDNPERGVPGDAAAASRKWHFSHNWRESAKDVPGGKGWVPPTAKDVLKERIELLSLDPNDPNFLRPPAGSPLATAGAGGDLPGYVGAVPPEGLEPWDWERTWNARMGR